MAESREDSETESQEAETDEAENRRLTGTKARIDEEKPIEVNTLDFIKTMKGLDTVESLSAGAARDPNRNMYGNRNNYLHFCDIHSFQY